MSTIGPCSRGKVLSAKPKNIFFLIRNLMELNFYLQIEANLDQIGAKDEQVVIIKAQMNYAIIT
jgi:hypothetical protein